MLIMAEVTSEMGAELRASALARKTSVAAEVGRRLERLDRLEATVDRGSDVDGSGSIHPVHYRFSDDAQEAIRYLHDALRDHAKRHG